MPDIPEQILQFFAYAHLPEHLAAVSKPFSEMAATIVTTLPRNPERTVALRKLLEAKDAAVRAKLSDGRADRVKEDTSIEDFCAEMDRWHRSPQFRLLMLRHQLRMAWLRFVCAVTEHKPKPWGGKYWTDCGYELDDYRRSMLFYDPVEFLFKTVGQILGVVDLVDTARTEKVREALEAVGNPRALQEIHFGDYTTGRWAFRFDNQRRFNEPVPVRGALGIWGLTEPAVIEQVKKQLTVEATI